MEELAILRSGTCYLRNYPGSSFKKMLTEGHLKIIKENWSKLQNDIRRY